MKRAPLEMLTLGLLLSVQSAAIAQPQAPQQPGEGESAESPPHPEPEQVVLEEEPESADQEQPVAPSLPTSQPRSEPPKARSTPVPEQRPSEPTPPSGIRKHDGFFLRLGLGYGHTSFVLVQPAQERSLSADGLTFEALAGATPYPGLVVGGGMISSAAPDEPDERANLGDRPTDATRIHVFGLLGPFGAYYPDPGSGLHFDGMIGLATVSPKTKIDNPKHFAGVGAALGLGYELWVGEQWSIGPTARFVYASMGNANDNYDERYRALGGQLALAATLH